jgi:hypothetical protein
LTVAHSSFCTFSISRTVHGFFPAGPVDSGIADTDSRMWFWSSLPGHITGRRAGKSKIVRYFILEERIIALYSSRLGLHGGSGGALRRPGNPGL